MLKPRRLRSVNRSFAMLVTVVGLIGLVFSAAPTSFAAPAVSGAAPTIVSDQADYPAGATVHLSGTGWQPGESVAIVVNDTIGQTWHHDATVTAASDGTIVDTFALPNYFISNYDVTATGPLSGTATTTFTDANPSADLDQCANGPAPSPNTDGCDTAAGDWVNGNVGASKANYFEGDSLPYRILFGSLVPGSSHTVTIAWDTTKGGKHALDYLTTFNRTVANANPCLGVSGCGSPTTFAIPADPQVTGAGVTPVPGNFTMYNATITGVSAYAGGVGFPAGDNSRAINITFTTSSATPVLAWGGHIASRVQWGVNNSAAAISGSPFHTALVGLDGSGGAQDRSLSAAAVTFPGAIIIQKQAIPTGATAFPFTASPAPLSNFSLVDDGTVANNTKAFTNITNFTTYTVTETAPLPTDWSLTGVVCSVASPNGGSQTVNGAQTTINLAEGEIVTCTYTDTRAQNAVLALTKTDNLNPATYDHVGQVVTYTLTATNTGDVTLHNVTVSDTPALTGFSCSPAIPVATLSPGAHITCTGTHAITQADLDAGSFADTGHATSTEATAPDAPDTIQAAQSAVLALTKTDNLKPATYDHVGQVVTYTLTATNTGNVTLHNVTVSDTPALDRVLVPAHDPGRHARARRVGHLHRHACDHPGRPRRRLVHRHRPRHQHRNRRARRPRHDPGCQVGGVGVDQDRQPQAGELRPVGQVVTYTLTATNTGNVTLHNVTVSDTPALTAFTCLPTIPVATLAPGASVTCTGTHAITQADLDAGSFTDTGHATSTEAAAPDAPDTIQGAQSAVLALTKTDNLNPATYNTVGQVVTYTLTATNTGNVTLHNVTVSDTPALDRVLVPAHDPGRHAGAGRVGHLHRHACDHPGRPRCRLVHRHRPRHQHRNPRARRPRHHPSHSRRGVGVDQDRQLEPGELRHGRPGRDLHADREECRQCDVAQRDGVGHARPDRLLVPARRSRSPRWRPARRSCAPARMRSPRPISMPARSPTPATPPAPKPTAPDAPDTIQAAQNAVVGTDQDRQPGGELRHRRSGRDLHADRDEYRQCDVAQRDGVGHARPDRLLMFARHPGRHARARRADRVHRHACDHPGRSRCRLVHRHRPRHQHRNARARRPRHHPRRPERSVGTDQDRRPGRRTTTPSVSS